MELFNSHKILFTAAIALIAAVTFTGCKQVKVGPKGETLNTDTLGTYIEKRLKNNVTGYQIVIYSKGTIATAIAGGAARKAPDTNPRKMMISDKINLASISKTITAAALLKLLGEKSISINAPVYPYLPNNWKRGARVDGITFRQLLRHSAGFNGSDMVYTESYADLKKLVADGPAGDTTFLYRNCNYAIMRMLIANLAGAKITIIGAIVGKDPDPSLEALQAQEYTDAYMQYCQDNIFSKLAAYGKNIACKPTDASPALCYKYQAPDGNGTDWGDMTLTNAARGWNMSALDLAAFLNVLTNTNAIVPKAAAAAMLTDSLGFDRRQHLPSGVTVTEKAGGYPPDGNNGVVDAWIFNFDNGIQVTAIVNSNYTNDVSSVEADVLAAFSDWYK